MNNSATVFLKIGAYAIIIIKIVYKVLIMMINRRSVLRLILNKFQKCISKIFCSVLKILATFNKMMNSDPNSNTLEFFVANFAAHMHINYSL